MLVTARRMHDLELVESVIPEVRPIEQGPRPLTRRRAAGGARCRGRATSAAARGRGRPGSARHGRHPPQCLRHRRGGTRQCSDTGQVAAPAQCSDSGSGHPGVVAHPGGLDPLAGLEVAAQLVGQGEQQVLLRPRRPAARRRSPRSARNASTSRTSTSGTLAPLVTPTVVAPRRARRGRSRRRSRPGGRRGSRARGRPRPAAPSSRSCVSPRRSSGRCRRPSA